MTLTAGTTLGLYEIAAPLGAGGMGEVYLATDTKLDRQVAIKVLPETMTRDNERVARFEREAKLLASLNHPNIAAVHGFDESDGTRFLVMEYVEGETLARRLESGPFDVEDALDIAMQMAAALEAAHEKGVIHRDLKPANVMIRADGSVKVLDFGLAKAMSEESSGLQQSDSPTITANFTRPGVVLGTAAYMSPEQARGRALDKRTDIWSFGIILFECLSGSRLFQGETANDSIGAILHKEPDWSFLPPDTPPMVRHVLRRCLTKSRNERLRDIGDARIDLELARQTPEYGEEPTAGSSKRFNLLAVLAAAILFAVLGAGSVVFLGPQTVVPVIRASIEPTDNEVIIAAGDMAGPATLSRDGSRIVYVARRTGEQARLFVRALNSSHAESLRGTDGATFPFWSWDGQSIAYFANGTMRSHDLATGTNRTICVVLGGRGGAWLADGTIVFAPNFQSPIHRIPEKGGVSVAVTTIDETRHTSHRWPSASPNGLTFIYSAVSHVPGMLDECAIFLATGDNASDIEVTRSMSSASIVSDHLLVVRGSTLLATPFDASTGALTGEARPLVHNVLSDLSTWYASFSAAATGTLVFHARSTDTAMDPFADDGGAIGESSRTTIYLRDGRPSAVVADGVPQNGSTISPGFEFLAVSAAPDGQSSGSGFDIWLYRLPSQLAEGTADNERSTQDRIEEPPRRLTYLPGSEVSPVWSPDGAWIAFGKLHDGRSATPSALYRVRKSGGREEVLLEDSEGMGDDLFPMQWSPDGRFIIYARGSWVSVGTNDILALEVETGESFSLVQSDADESAAGVSPDGKWLLFDSKMSGTNEVYVIPFPPGWAEARAQGLAAPREDAQWRISIAGGALPRWNPSGGELFYISTSGSLISVQVATRDSEFTHDVGTALFAAHAETGTSFDVSKDGRRFAMNSAPDQEATSISILTNWHALLRD